MGPSQQDKDSLTGFIFTPSQQQATPRGHYLVNGNLLYTALDTGLLRGMTRGAAGESGQLFCRLKKGNVLMVTGRDRSLLLTVLYCVVASATACDLDTSVGDASPAQIAAFFADQGKQVVSFVGYSGAQYQDETALLQAAQDVLAKFEPSRTLVNIGATADGIGAVYKLAKREGFVTTGIVSTQARKYSAGLSPCVDHVFYVEDASWGGFVDGQQTLSPTSSAMVDSTDILIAIGGGSVARDELIAARRLGKEVRFIPADMNHKIARDKATKQGLQAPDSFSGAVDSAF